MTSSPNPGPDPATDVPFAEKSENLRPLAPEANDEFAKEALDRLKAFAGVVLLIVLPDGPTELERADEEIEVVETRRPAAAAVVAVDWMLLLSAAVAEVLPTATECLLLPKLRSDDDEVDTGLAAAAGETRSPPLC